MILRRWSLWFWLVCLGCHSLPSQEIEEVAPSPDQLWEQGQTAMRRGQPDEAIKLYQQSLAADPERVRNHLSLAAAYLEKKDLRSACAHLAKYVEVRPEQLTVHERYAELLIRLKQLPEACAALEDCVATGQEQKEATSQEIIDCHSRLVQVAEDTGDDYVEHLHRGIGLYLLARKRSGLADPEGEFPAESLFCRAAAELTLAHQTKPDEARPCWYLYSVWSHLGQHQPALCRLRQASAAAPFSYLTHSEQRQLTLATLSNQSMAVR